MKDALEITAAAILFIGVFPGAVVVAFALAFQAIRSILGVC